MNNGGNTSQRASRDAETQRLARANAAHELRCLRCGGAMAATQAWARSISVMSRDLEVVLTPDGSQPSFWTGKQESVGMHATTCLDCGYTEFYAQDLLRLKSLLTQTAAQDAPTD